VSALALTPTTAHITIEAFALIIIPTMAQIMIEMFGVTFLQPFGVTDLGGRGKHKHRGQTRGQGEGRHIGLPLQHHQQHQSGADALGRSGGA